MTNRERNVALMERFGEPEQLCNQIYQTHHGVTEYIDELENHRKKYRNNLLDDAYYGLKRVRHKRNLLSHGEAPLDQPCANDEDIAFVIKFRKDILYGNDPLAVYRRDDADSGKQNVKGFFVPILMTALVVLFGIFLVYLAVK